MLKKILIFIAVIILTSNVTNAGQCFEIFSPIEELERADIVFIGKVTNIKKYDKFNNIATFELDKIWKGQNYVKERKGKNYVNVRYLNGNLISIGLIFELNKKYIVYAYKENGVPFIDACSRTKEIENATNDLLEIGQPSNVLNTNKKESSFFKILNFMKNIIRN